MEQPVHTFRILYKYRDINSFKRFVDIILKSRIYAARFQDLNDPMEGQYYYRMGELSKGIKDKLLEEKGELRICSLSKVKDNHLMWSHYANGHRGVAIGLRIEDEQFPIKEIQYDGLASIRQLDFNDQTAIEILSHKLEVWNYEKEVRIFVKKTHFVKVEVEEVNTGMSMSKADYSFVRGLIQKINPKIRIIKADSFMQ